MDEVVEAALDDGHYLVRFDSHIGFTDGRIGPNLSALETRGVSGQKAGFAAAVSALRVAFQRKEPPVGETGGSENKHESLVGVNHLFAARGRIREIPVVAAGLRNVCAVAPFLEVSSVITCGERRARSEQDERQSCNNRFHFRSPITFEQKPERRTELAGGSILPRCRSMSYQKVQSILATAHRYSRALGGFVRVCEMLCRLYREALGGLPDFAPSEDFY
ncbi:MAG: hypothetical protein J2P54_06345 [Bradyrhizobiaceae bacterium]|nr:hypothetical protein [Bradyrhizobiaceae bacterium]